MEMLLRRVERLLERRHRVARQALVELQLKVHRVHRLLRYLVAEGAVAVVDAEESGARPHKGMEHAGAILIDLRDGAVVAFLRPVARVRAHIDLQSEI